MGFVQHSLVSSVHVLVYHVSGRSYYLLTDRPRQRITMGEGVPLILTRVGMPQEVSTHF